MKRRKLTRIPAKPPEEPAAASEPLAVSIHPITFEWATSLGRQSVGYLERRFLN
jgi:hypothetical protein